MSCLRAATRKARGEREVSPPRLHTTGNFLDVLRRQPAPGGCAETVFVGPPPKMRMNKKSGHDLIEDWLYVIPVLFDDFPVRIAVAAAGQSPSGAALDWR
jgi:hypothetical protein